MSAQPTQLPTALAHLSSTLSLVSLRLTLLAGQHIQYSAAAGGPWHPRPTDTQACSLPTALCQGEGTCSKTAVHGQVIQGKCPIARFACMTLRLWTFMPVASHHNPNSSCLRRSGTGMILRSSVRCRVDWQVRSVLTPLGSGNTFCAPLLLVAAAYCGLLLWSTRSSINIIILLLC